MKFSHLTYFLFIFLIYNLPGALAQNSEDNSLGNCENLLSPEYISSGQEYFADLNKNNKATFHATFYERTQYRVAACTDIKNHKLIFKIYDTEKNLLFSNVKHNYTSYWNLAFTSTVDCIIELKIKAKQQIKKPVKLLIGFKDDSKHIK
jgi:hypothetical protein